AEYISLEAKAKELGQPADLVFRAEAGGSLAALSALSLNAMHLPELFSAAILSASGVEDIAWPLRPSADADLREGRHPEAAALSIISYASQFTESVGVSLDPWAPRAEPTCPLLEEIGVDMEQARGLVKASVVAVAPYLPRDRRRRTSAVIEPKAA
nr:hypothetical protein [Fimbriimonadaceae bacterium]